MTFAIRFDGDGDDDNDDGERNAYTRTRLSSLCIYIHNTCMYLYILEYTKYETRACCHKFYMYWRSRKNIVPLCIWWRWCWWCIAIFLPLEWNSRVYLHSSKSLVVSRGGSRPYSSLLRSAPHATTQNHQLRTAQAAGDIFINAAQRDGLCAMMLIKNSS